MRSKEPRDILAEFRQITRASPGLSPRPVLVWAWNDRLSLPEIRRQARQIARSGVAGVLPLSQTGVDHPFPSSEWLDAMEACIDEMRRLGLRTWLSHTFDWPSGCDPLTHSAFGAKALCVEEIPASNSEAPIPQTGSSLALFAARRTSAGLSDLHRLPFAPPETPPETPPEADAVEVDPGSSDLVGPVSGADGVLLRFFWKPASGVDPLDRGAVRAFMDAGIEVYYREFGEEFAHTIAGIAVYDIGTVGPSWSPGLTDVCRELFDQDILDLLPAVFYEAPEMPDARRRYWAAVSEAMARNCTDQLQQWCDNREILFLPAYRGQGADADQAAARAGIAPQYWHAAGSCLQVDGEGIASVAAVKRAASVARQKGGQAVAARVFQQETWSVAPEELLHTAAMQIASGANLILPGLALLSQRGDRKRSVPGSIHFQQPWWPRFRDLADTLSRVLLILSEGQAIAEIVVIGSPDGSPNEFGVWYAKPDESGSGPQDDVVAGQGGREPQTTDGGTRSLVQPSSRPDDARSIDDSVGRLVEGLAAIPCDFDLADESDLSTRAHLIDGKLSIGRSAYRAAVVPGGVQLSEAAERMLSSFSLAGGRVLLIGDGAQDAAAPGRTGIPGVVWASNSPVSLASALEGVPFRVKVRSVDNGAAPVLWQHRDLGRYQFLFLVNSSRKDPVDVRVEFRAEGRLEEWDCESGEVRPASATRTEVGVGARIRIPEAGMTLLGLDTARPALEPSTAPGSSRPVEEVAAEAGGLSEVLELDSPWQLTLDGPNALPLDWCGWKVGAGEWQPEAPVRQIREAAPAGENSEPLFLRFAFNVDPGLPLKGLMLAMEDPDEWSVVVNGTPFPTRDAGWWVDPCLRKFDISRLVNHGRNFVLMTRAAGQGVDVEGPHLLGAFGVIGPVGVIGLVGSEKPHSPGNAFQPTGTGHRFEIGPLARSVPADALCRQGLPFYWGSVHLEQSVRIPRRGDSRVVLTMQAKGMVRVRVNGRDAGSRICRPYKIDVTDFVRRGKNHLIIELTGTHPGLCAGDRARRPMCSIPDTVPLDLSKIELVFPRVPERE